MKLRKISYQEAAVAGHQNLLWNLFGVGSKQGSKAFEKALLPTHCFFCVENTLVLVYLKSHRRAPARDIQISCDIAPMPTQHSKKKISKKNKLALGKRAGLARMACSQSSSTTISCHLWVVHYCWVPLLLLLLVSVCWTPVA